MKECLGIVATNRNDCIQMMKHIAKGFSQLGLCIHQDLNALVELRFPDIVDWCSESCLSHK